MFVEEEMIHVLYILGDIFIQDFWHYKNAEPQVRLIYFEPVYEQLCYISGMKKYTIIKKQIQFKEAWALW